ncbi:IS256 family transposase [Corynebacterium diphtheriae]
MIFLDTLCIKVRDGGRVVNKSAYMAIGVDIEGIKHILGLWIAKEKGASFWVQVCSNLSNRGVKDVFIVCCDGLKGLPEAGEVTWSGPMVQTCVVHLIRAANRWGAYGDRKGVSAALEKVYTAFDEAGAVAALAEFADSEFGEKYPRSAKVWCDAWERFVPFCSFRRQPAMLSTSRIRLSRLTMSCVNLPATASNFTNDESALKALWLMICNIEDKRLAKRAKEGWRVAASAGRFVEGGKVSGWKQAINQMAVAYSDRFDQYL